MEIERRSSGWFGRSVLLATGPALGGLGAVAGGELGDRRWRAPWTSAGELLPPLSA